MIPVSLMLKNFMSYGDEGQTLSFEGIHVACLCGDNGNGKSAILDAITWALWGKTRASAVQSVTDDDLIRRSAEEMEVRFEFRLNDQVYRVVRKRRRGKPGDWQFAQALEGGQFAAIGSGGSREVGRQISQLLNMEYETFLASAYLQQGHADEFTRQKPAQRKQILSEILGLDQYDRLEAKARERARDLKTIGDELEGQIRVLEASVSRRAELDTELATVREQAKALDCARAVQEDTVTALRESRVRLDGLLRQREEMTGAERTIRADLQSATTGAARQRDRVAQLQATIAQRDAILTDFQALATARLARERLEPQIEEYSRKRSDLQAISSEIAQERARLQGDLKEAEADARSAERQAAELERTDQRIAASASALREEPEVLAHLAARQTEADGQRERFEALRSRNRELTSALAELDEVLALLELPRAACPVCESDLTGQRRDRVIARQQEKRAALAAEQAAVQKEGGACKRWLETAQVALRELEERQSALAVQRGTLDSLQRARVALAGVPSELAAALERAVVLRKQLETDDFAHPKRVQLKRLEQDIARLESVSREYTEAGNRVRALAEADSRHRQLRDAEQRIDSETEEQVLQEALANAKQRALAEFHADTEALERKIAAMAPVRADCETAEAELGKLNQQADSLRRREGATQGALDDCDRSELQRRAKEAERKQAQQEFWIHDRLVGCFGKKGIQALIIENAIPELEQEANRLLACVSDNGMQVRFHTTRAGKTTKSEIETLDISIIDSAGPRPYELFSGGEAFRVNFAIRIALSRMLAGRSGARLQTLILDEGFGTQDGKGREKLIEAIESIKPDFDKILVITHVEELKDSFAQRIEITKDDKGSLIHVY